MSRRQRGKGDRKEMRKRSMQRIRLGGGKERGETK